LKQNGINMDENLKLETRNYNSNEELYAAITKEGSLGILALGSSGLLLWRKKQAELKAAEEKEKQK
jgi:hypothetical protein